MAFKNKTVYQEQQDIVGVSPLAKVKNGIELILDKDQIYKFNHPNYVKDDIIVSQMGISVSPFDEKQKRHISKAWGKCEFSENMRFPEVFWDHISASLMLVIITQSGKTFHNICSDVKGVGLAKFNGSIRKAVPLEDITFEFDAETSVKFGNVWSKKSWVFYHAGKPFSFYETLSRGVDRDYSEVEKRQKKNKAPVFKIINA